MACLIREIAGRPYWSSSDRLSTPSQVLWITSHFGCALSLILLSGSIFLQGVIAARYLACIRFLRAPSHIGSFLSEILTYCIAFLTGIERAASICVLAMLSFVAFFAIGSGPVTWVYLSEILPNEIKGVVASAATAINWASNSAIAATFPLAVTEYGLGQTYMVFALLNIVAVFFGLSYMVETKLLHMDEIQRLLRAR
jgi:hypothetical protein